METLNDAIMRVTGGPTVSDGLRSYFIANGGSIVAAVAAAGGTLNDIIRAFLNSQGIPYGVLNDMWMQFLTLLSYQGTRNDMEYQWWSGANGWSPTYLFQAGEQGAWYDPSDFNSMYQDAAGTTPVTAVEQPVGKILDKSGNGNHASQATSAARPVISARKNLLTKTEQTNVSPWAFTNASGTATQTGNNYTFGASAVDRVLQAGVSLTTGIQVTASVTLSGSGNVRLFILDGLGATVGALTIALTSTPTKYTTTVTAAQTGGSGGIGIYNNAAGTAGAAFTIHNTQLEYGPTATRYQRVNTATDYDSVGFLRYLRFDGVDDLLQTAAFNFGPNVSYASALNVRSIPTSTKSLFYFPASPTTGLLAVTTNGGTIRAYGPVSASSVPASTATAADKQVVVGLLTDGVAVTGYKDGVAGAPTPTSGNVAQPSALQIGTAVSDLNFYGGITVNRLLSTTEVSAVTRYLANKSGVTVP